MCGRFSAPFSLADVMTAFDAVPYRAEHLTADYNVAPTDPAQVVRDRDGTRVVTTMRWGLVAPHWGNARDAARRINARSETVLEKPSFRHPFLRHRCIVPVAGFYEWSDRRPFLITPAQGDLLALAGLWERNGDLRTFTILTTEANETMQALHHRMPVILEASCRDEWLSDTDVVSLQRLLVPAAV